jgi:Ca2+-binding EF-hand superfamily protein
MDLDQNGKVYWSEFLSATISQTVFLKEENLKEAFSKFDTEKKGHFGVDDLMKVFSTSGIDIKNKEVEMVFKEAFP